MLIGNWIGQAGGGVQSYFRRDYAPLVTCAASAWSAANLPLIAIAWFAPELLVVASAAAYIWFVLLMFFAVRTVFGTRNGAAIAIVGLSWIPLVVAYFVRGPVQMILGWLASPFLLLYIFFFLRSDIGGAFSDLGAGLRRGQSFRRNLEAAAINPHDAEAQYQLGLIYQQRRQSAEAIKRFENAVAIDPAEADALFQLGRIAREQGRLKDALGYFQKVVNLDEHHHQSEILRELGALYITARQYNDALSELLKYEQKHPYDAEGLYYHGQALEGLGKPREAREIYARAVEAASLAPAYIRRAAGKWGRLARARMKYDHDA
jgi:Tfp pilus assembly protein PilF